MGVKKNSKILGCGLNHTPPQHFHTPATFRMSSILRLTLYVSRDRDYITKFITFVMYYFLHLLLSFVWMIKKPFNAYINIDFLAIL